MEIGDILLVGWWWYLNEGHPNSAMTLGYRCNTLRLEYKYIATKKGLMNSFRFQYDQLWQQPLVLAWFGYSLQMNTPIPTRSPDLIWNVKSCKTGGPSYQICGFNETHVGRSNESLPECILLKASQPEVRHWMASRQGARLLALVSVLDQSWGSLKCVRGWGHNEKKRQREIKTGNHTYFL
jgi:hypothetical protein